MPPFTYDVTTDRGRVRLLITDRDAANEIFNDNEIDAFLALMDNNVFRAAAIALFQIAASEALLLKVIKLLELTTDGARVADSLRGLALEYQEKADLAEAGEVGGAFDYAEMVYDEFSFRERLAKEALRAGGGGADEEPDVWGAWPLP
jgi:hypothetical protein